MSPHGWLRFILDITERYHHDEPRPLQQLAKRLSALDGDPEEQEDDPITERIWGRAPRRSREEA